MQCGSFRELYEDWFQAEVLDRELQQPSAPRRYLDKYLIPKLGQMAACDIHASDIARILDGMKKRAPAAANDLLRFTRRIFAFGTRRRLVASNLAADLSPRLDGGGTERARNRELNLDELARLFEAIRKTPSFSGVEGTFDCHDYYKERRAALGQWTELLVQAESGSTRVVPIHGFMR